MKLTFSLVCHFQPFFFFILFSFLMIFFMRQQSSHLGHPIASIDFSSTSFSRVEMNECVCFNHSLRKWHFDGKMKRANIRQRRNEKRLNDERTKEREEKKKNAKKSGCSGFSKFSHRNQSSFYVIHKIQLYIVDERVHQPHLLYTHLVFHPRMQWRANSMKKKNLIK